ncbi:hypothetical protein [Nocardia xishanensis]|uniref:Membrane protein YesL n=1 Tax=Nocardia xishanensis TaxID=238964 RepID=A0ABW7WS04_9NOCA
MTDTPSSAPKDPAGGTPRQGGESEQFAAQPGQHESGAPYAPPPGVGNARHEMPGGAGYPQFEGPGAAQYGAEPVEPPPAVAAQQPAYGPPGSGTGIPQQYGAPQQYGTPEYGVPQQPGTIPPGATPGQPVYGYQVGTPGGLDVGHALSYGLEKFRTNLAPWLGITALGVVIYLVFVLFVQIFEPNSFLPLVLLFLAVMAALWLLQAAMVRGALYETDGAKPVFGSYFKFVNAGNVLLTALLAFLGTWIGLALCVIPGLLVGMLCMFALHFVVDQDLGPFDAIRSSAILVINNIWPVLLLALSVAVITFLGLLLCGIGLLAAGPVSIIAVTYAYRTLTGGRVAQV